MGRSDTAGLVRVGFNLPRRQRKITKVSGGTGKQRSRQLLHAGIIQQLSRQQTLAIIHTPPSLVDPLTSLNIAPLLPFLRQEGKHTTSVCVRQELRVKVRRRVDEVRTRRRQCPVTARHRLSGFHAFTSKKQTHSFCKSQFAPMQFSCREVQGRTPWR